MIRPWSAAAQFEFGTLRIAPGAIGNVNYLDIANAITRHVRGDWGDVPQRVKAANDGVMREPKGQLISAFQDRHGTDFGIRTNAERTETVVFTLSDVRL